MTRINQTVWTCDRCHHRTQGEGVWQPNDWAKLIVASPPQASGGEALAHLCRSCRDSLSAWLRAREVIE